MGTTDYEIPDKQLELLARMLLPEIKKFFADEEVKKEFEQWQSQQKNDIESTKSKDIKQKTTVGRPRAHPLFTQIYGVTSGKLLMANNDEI